MANSWPSRWRKQLIRRGWGMELFCIGSDNKFLFFMAPQRTQRRTQSTQGPTVSFVPFLVSFVVKKNLAIRRILFLIMFLSCQVSYAQIKIAYDQNSAPI